MEHNPSDPARERDSDLPIDLRSVARRYAGQPLPAPSEAETGRLLAALLAEEPTARARGTVAARPDWRDRARHAAQLARWRVRLLAIPFWVASLLVLGLGLVAARPLMASGRAAATALIFVVPLTAALGLVYALRTSSGGLREVEAATPTGAAETLGGLVLVIVGFECALGTIATAGLALLARAPFGATLIAWLGPLLLLTGCALLAALRWGAAPAALLVGIPWALLAAGTQLRAVGPFAPPDDGIALASRLAVALIGGILIALTLARGPAWPPAPQRAA